MRIIIDFFNDANLYTRVIYIPCIYYYHTGVNGVNIEQFINYILYHSKYYTIIINIYYIMSI